MNLSFSLTSIVLETVYYQYVDRNCTITATGGTDTFEGVSIDYPNLYLNLKKGWNAIHMKATTTGTGGFVNISIGDSSSCKWVYGD